MGCVCVEAAEVGLVEVSVEEEGLEDRERVEEEPWLIVDRVDRDAYLLGHIVLHEESRDRGLLGTPLV